MLGVFFVYILKSALCMAVFYLFYRLLLSKETFHRFNRIALLGLFVLSCVIPLVEVTLKDPGEVSRQVFSLEELWLMAELNNADEVVGDPVATAWSWREICLLIYVFGIFFFLLRHVWSMTRMLRLMKRSVRTKRSDGIVLVTHEEEVAPFSWMNYVVISKRDLDENGREILAHECAHIRNWHSLDLLAADICIFFQWFNPAAWLLKQELQNIHEFEADDCVIRQGVDAKHYQLLLIKKAVGTRLYSMANSFNHSSLKKRITMMLKRKSNPWARLKYLYVLPLAAIAVVAFARPEVSQELNEISAVKINDLAAIMKVEEVKSAEKRSSSSDQVVKVSGQVIDKEEQTPIVGAIVKVLGSTKGTVTDNEGRFTLELPKEERLEVSYVGYATMILSARSGSDVQLTLELIKDETSSSKVQEASLSVAERMPEFPGGMSELLKFMGYNIRYPEEAKQQQKQGRVLVQFVVGKDGSINHPVVIRSVCKSLDEEALRVVSSMPKWNPGLQDGQPVDVKYVVPVTFSLSQQDTVRKKSENPMMLKLIEQVGKEGKPIILVDGEKKSRSYLTDLDPTQISTIEIVGPERGLEIYGEDGKNGVILMKLKKGQTQDKKVNE